MNIYPTFKYQHVKGNISFKYRTINNAKVTSLPGHWVL